MHASTAAPCAYVSSAESYRFLSVSGRGQRAKLGKKLRRIQCVEFVRSSGTGGPRRDSRERQKEKEATMSDRKTGHEGCMGRASPTSLRATSGSARCSGGIYCIRT